MSDKEESVSKCDHHSTSVLGTVNGFFKLNYEVPKPSLLYSSDCLLPINAKVNSIILNNTINKSHEVKTPDRIANNLKTLSLKTHENKENLDDKQSDSSNLGGYQLKTYSKPLYSGNSYYVERNEEQKRSLSPKGENENNFNVVGYTSSLLDNQTLAPSLLQTYQNDFTDFTNRYKNEKLEEVFHGNQEQEQGIQMESVKNNFNNAQMSTSQTSISANEIEIINDLSHKSLCPLCFKSFPTPIIEFHASECSI